MSECLSSPSVQDTAKESHFSLAPSRVLNRVGGRGEEEDGKAADKILGGH